MLILLPLHYLIAQIPRESQAEAGNCIFNYRVLRSSLRSGPTAAGRRVAGGRAALRGAARSSVGAASMGAPPRFFSFELLCPEADGRGCAVIIAVNWGLKRSTRTAWRSTCSLVEAFCVARGGALRGAARLRWTARMSERRGGPRTAVALTDSSLMAFRCVAEALVAPGRSWQVSCASRSSFGCVTL